MSSIKERQKLRETELMDMLKSRNIKMSNYCGYCNKYIKIGGHPNAYEICDILEEDRFFYKNKNYSPYAYNNYVFSAGYKYRSDILIEYVKDNYSNIHKILAEIPWTLKPKVDIIYEALIDSYDTASIKLKLENNK